MRAERAKLQISPQLIAPRRDCGAEAQDHARASPAEIVLLRLLHYADALIAAA
jgi:hypothetical protein